MKIQDTNNNVGDEFYGVVFNPAGDDIDTEPERFDNLGLYKVDNVIVEADENTQKESVRSKHKITRQNHSCERDTTDGKKKIFSNPVEIIDDSIDIVFKDCHVFKTKDEAENFCNKRNVFMIYVIKIKGSDKILYTRRFDKVISLLEKYWTDDDDIQQKIIIERTQKTHDEWINMDVTPMTFIQQMVRGNVKEITKEIRQEEIGNFVMDEDEDVTDFDDTLEMFRDIEKFTSEKSSEAKIEFEEKESASDILKEMFKNPSEEDMLLGEPSSRPIKKALKPISRMGKR